MHAQVEMWHCYGDTLIYKSPKGEEHDDCLTLVDLKSGKVRQI